MAHLLVSSETVIDQENISFQYSSSNPRSIGKHKRTSQGEYSFDFSGGSIHTNSGSKRRALASITNQALSKEKPTVSGSKANNSFQSVRNSTLHQNSLSLFTTQPDLFPLSSSYPAPACNDDVTHFGGSTAHLQPIGKPVGSSHSRCISQLSLNTTSSSFNSFRALESPASTSLLSPMLITSPDNAFSSHLECKEIIDIDLLDDPNCAVSGDYTKDIFAYLKDAEERFHPLPYYMNKQPDVTIGMRCILVDWLVEVVDEFKLSSQTLYLAMSIVDRFLSIMSIMRNKLQLVGVTAMYIAAKFEEIFPPELTDFAYITDDTYTKPQIVRMELLILKTLDFNITAPTVHVFLLRYLKAAEAEQLHPTAATAIGQTFQPFGGMVAKDSVETVMQSISSLSEYLSELSLMDGDPYLKYYPSVIAASAVCLARHTLGQIAWPSILQHYSGYGVSDIGNCVQDLHRTFAMSPQHSQQAIRTKYNSETFMKVSTLKVPETLPC